MTPRTVKAATAWWGRDEEFYAALKECADHPIPVGTSKACQTAKAVRSIYPYLLPSIGACPPGPEPQTPGPVIDVLTQSAFYTEPEKKALADYVHEEYGRHMTRYRDNADFCASLPGDHDPPDPVPPPGPEPEPQQGKLDLPSPIPFVLAAALFAGLMLRKKR